MYGYIYKTTNKINGTIYIGKRKGEFTSSYKGSGKYLRRALNKYGDCNFFVEVIEYCETLEIQNEREQFWIAYYRNLDVSMYNIARGGDGGDLVSCLPQTERLRFSQRISELNKLGIIGNKGKQLSEEHKKKIGDGNRGKVHSEEWKKKHDDAIRGKVAWNKGLTKDDFRVAKYARKKGEFKHTEETKRLISERTRGCKKPSVSTNIKGRKWMNNGVRSVMAKADEIESYKKMGYIEGRL